MPMVIQSGVKEANLALVTRDNRLGVDAATRTKLAQRSAEGKAFTLSTPLLTLTATGGRVLWFTNDSSSLLAQIDRIYFCWNGGSTNHNRSMYGAVYLGDTKPTTNITAVDFVNLNTLEQPVFEVDAVYWNETGDGMTGYTAGTASVFVVVGGGGLDYHFDGGLIIGPGGSLGINLQGEEAGEASVNLFGFFDERGILE